MKRVLNEKIIFYILFYEVDYKKLSALLYLRNGS